MWHEWGDKNTRRVVRETAGQGTLAEPITE
jgi:hypothetical protein